MEAERFGREGPKQIKAFDLRTGAPLPAFAPPAFGIAAFDGCSPRSTTGLLADETLSNQRSARIVELVRPRR